VTTVRPYWGATDFAAAANLEGHPVADPAIRPLCMQPDEMGRMVVDLCNLPAHLEVQDITVKPLVQDIIPL
jgi:hypothetical protein